MTKTKKNGLILFLVAILLGTCVFFCLPKTATALADENRFGDLSNGEYAFEDGAYFHTDIAGEDIAIGFNLQKLTNKYDDLNKLESNHYEWWGDLKRSEFRYSFTLCRAGEETFTELSKMTVSFYYSESGMKVMILTQALSHCKETFFTGWAESLIKKEDSAATKAQLENLKSKNGVKYVNSGTVYDDSLTEDDIMIKICVPSAYERYFIRVDYAFNRCTYSGILKTTYEWGKTRTVYSPIRSLYDMLVIMEPADPDFENFGATYGETLATKANAIVDNVSKRTVTVEWLENLEDTPFAIRKSADVEIPIYDSEPKIEDVLVALDKKTLNVHDSYVYGFNQNDEGHYVAYYLKNSFFKGVTNDGNDFTYYLDINKSYKDMYYPFVEAGFIDSGLYELQFTKMIDKYPNVQGVAFDELYGTWGFGILPQPESLNKLFSSLFDIENSQVGAIGLYAENITISKEKYEELCADYGYGWLQGFIDWFLDNREATVYTFWTEPGTRGVFIQEGGASSGKGVVAQKIGKDVQKIEKTTSSVFDAVTDTVQDVAGGISNISSKVTGGVNTLFGSTLSSLLIVAVIIVVIVTFNKNKKRRKR